VEDGGVRTWMFIVLNLVLLGVFVRSGGSDGVVKKMIFSGFLLYFVVIWVIIVCEEGSVILV
jgi:hypothetical protein